MPSAVRPWSFWKARTAAAVAVPKNRSRPCRGYPSSISRSCISFTPSPSSPCCSTPEDEGRVRGAGSRSSPPGRRRSFRRRRPSAVRALVLLEGLDRALGRGAEVAVASVERYPRSISIRCSSETRLLSSPRCTAEEDVDEAVLPASSAERVALPATPSADRPRVALEGLDRLLRRGAEVARGLRIQVPKVDQLLLQVLDRVAFVPLAQRRRTRSPTRRTSPRASPRCPGSARRCSPCASRPPQGPSRRPRKGP